MSRSRMPTSRPVSATCGPVVGSSSRYSGGAVQLEGELEPLTFAAGQAVQRLAEGQVAQSDIAQGSQRRRDGRVGGDVGAVGNGEVQDVGDGSSVDDALAPRSTTANSSHALRNATSGLASVGDPATAQRWVGESAVDSRAPPVVTGTQVDTYRPRDVLSPRSISRSKLSGAPPACWSRSVLFSVTNAVTLTTESCGSPLAVAGRKTLPGIVARVVLDVMTRAITVANLLAL